MNFFDTYEIARSTTPDVEQVENNEQPTLNEEVSQVIGQLGRFWGGFRKQVCGLLRLIFGIRSDRTWSILESTSAGNGKKGLWRCRRSGAEGDFQADCGERDANGINLSAPRGRNDSDGALYRRI